MKQWLATAFLVILLGLIIFTTFSEKDEGEQQESSATQETGMVAPNAPDGLKVGEKAPDFSLETLSGETVKLSDYRGKKIFLNYWATWCPPCRDEMPEMQDFHEKYGDEVVILAVNGTGTEKKKENITQFVKDGGYTFPILLDTELEINQTYQILSIPTTYFIGTDGIIQEPRIVGPMTYEMMEKKKDALN
ncbi:redoxin domain-containing protein [Halobacillus litoralis]|uniref:Redoxin domain-containing protein n=1 Tax=Halobacillus litoralis TaxID=45668 RepID=A0A845DZ66_9BACI|nr:redoxin domain-containing protein [Halobacillus litoralis]MYL48594.1 redoxin domain-containing protein [Halobacillus litoralis]